MSSQQPAAQRPAEQQPDAAQSGTAPFEDHDFGGDGAPVDIPDHVEPYSSRDDGGSDAADTAPFTEHVEPVESAPTPPE